MVDGTLAISVFRILTFGKKVFFFFPPFIEELIMAVLREMYK